MFTRPPEFALPMNAIKVQLDEHKIALSPLSHLSNSGLIWYGLWRQLQVYACLHKFVAQCICSSFFLLYFIQAAGKIIVLRHHYKAHHDITAWISAELKIQIKLKSRKKYFENQHSSCKKEIRWNFPFGTFSLESGAATHRSRYEQARLHL